MKEIYDLGYQEIGDFDLIARTVFELDALLIDIRLKAQSPTPVWRAQAFSSKLGARYRHLPELGNVNYRSTGEIKIRDLQKGLGTVLQLVKMTNLVLMCACKNRQGCHRQAVAWEIQNNHGISVHPLTVTYCIALAYHALQPDLIPNP